MSVSGKIGWGFALLFVLSQQAFCQANDASAGEKGFYELGNYRIYPGEKRVDEGGMIGGCSPNGLCWDGYGYAPVKLDYDTTILVFFAGRFEFKERLQTNDVSSLRVLYQNIRDGYSPVIMDNQTVYYRNGLVDSSSPELRVALPSMKRLNDYLFEDAQGDTYAIPVDYYRSQSYRSSEEVPFKIDNLELDPATLTHIAEQCFADQNGLYWLGSYSHYVNSHLKTGVNLQLEDNFGGNTVPVLYPSYIIYGDAIYYRDKLNGPVVKKLNDFEGSLHSADIVQIEGDLILFRNGKLYMPRWIDGTHQYQLEVLLEGKEVIAPVTWDMDYQWVEKDGNLYFKGETSGDAGDGKVLGALARTREGYYLFDARKAHEPRSLYQKVFIYTHPAGEYEDFDLSQFRRIDNWFFVYKGVLYGFDNPTSSNDKRFNFEQLKPIADSGFYTDGHMVFFNNRQELYGYRHLRGAFYARVFEPIDEEMIIEGVDLPSLQIIGNGLIVDQNRIYNSTGHQMQIVPRDKLGFDIQIVN